MDVIFTPPQAGTLQISPNSLSAGGVITVTVSDPAASIAVQPGTGVQEVPVAAGAQVAVETSGILLTARRDATSVDIAVYGPEPSTDGWIES